MKIKNLLLDTEWKTVHLLKRGVSTLDVCNATVARSAAADLEASWLPLHEVSSAHEGNRRAYLENNVLMRNYKKDERLVVKYFCNGK